MWFCVVHLQEASNFFGKYNVSVAEIADDFDDSRDKFQDEASKNDTPTYILQLEFGEGHHLAVA